MGGEGESPRTDPTPGRGWLRAAGHASPWSLAFVLFAAAALSARLLSLVSRYAVNVFFMDQWDFNDATLFERHSLWEMFRWQHGPHRQGLGALVTYFLEPSFRWNSRDDSFLACMTVVLATLCALALKKRLSGEITPWDLCIPLIFLTPLQYEALLITANLSQGPLPLLLLLAYCAAWTLPGPRLRYPLVLLINFVAIHTGYCFFLGAITPVALLLDYWLGTREAHARKTYLFAGLAVSGASLALFFAGYTYKTEVDCTPNLLTAPWAFAKFLLLMFANVVGAKQSSLWSLLAGGALAAAMAAALFLSLRRLARRTAPHRSAAWSAAILIGFTLLFAANAAYGRSCLGLGSAQQSRYIIWMEPGLFGLYLLLQALVPKGLKTGLLLMLAATLAGTVPLRREDRSILEFVSSAKRNWSACYRESEDIRGCNHRVGYGVYPAATAKLKAKLDFLRITRQNLYAPQP